jgi:hypothetical protein
MKNCLKKMFKIALLMLLVCLLSTSRTFAFDQINKDLNLVKGYSFLLNFDDRVIRYNLGNNESAKIELVSSIFDNKQELIIKTLKETDTNLLVWTKDGIFNFNVSIVQNKQGLPVVSEVKNSNSAGSPIIQNFSKDDQNLPDDIKKELEELSLDIPPHLPGKSQNIFGFQIDQPPRM